MADKSLPNYVEAVFASRWLPPKAAVSGRAVAGVTAQRVSQPLQIRGPEAEPAYELLSDEEIEKMFALQKEELPYEETYSA